MGQQESHAGQGELSPQPPGAEPGVAEGAEPGTPEPGSTTPQPQGRGRRRMDKLFRRAHSTLEAKFRGRERSSSPQVIKGGKRGRDAAGSSGSSSLEGTPSPGIHSMPRQGDVEFRKSSSRGSTPTSSLAVPRGTGDRKSGSSVASSSEQGYSGPELDTSFSSEHKESPRGTALKGQYGTLMGSTPPAAAVGVKSTGSGNSTTPLRLHIPPREVKPQRPVIEPHEAMVTTVVASHKPIVSSEHWEVMPMSTTDQRKSNSEGGDDTYTHHGRSGSSRPPPSKAHSGHFPVEATLPPDMLDMDAHHHSAGSDNEDTGLSPIVENKEALGGPAKTKTTTGAAAPRTGHHEHMEAKMNGKADLEDLDEKVLEALEYVDKSIEEGLAGETISYLTGSSGALSNDTINSEDGITSTPKKSRTSSHRDAEYINLDETASSGGGGVRLSPGEGAMESSDEPTETSPEDYQEARFPNRLFLPSSGASSALSTPTDDVFADAPSLATETVDSPYLSATESHADSRDGIPQSEMTMLDSEAEESGTAMSQSVYEPREKYEDGTLERKKSQSLDHLDHADKRAPSTPVRVHHPVNATYSVGTSRVLSTSGQDASPVNDKQRRFPSTAADDRRDTPTHSPRPKHPRVGSESPGINGGQIHTAGVPLTRKDSSHSRSVDSGLETTGDLSNSLQKEEELITNIREARFNFAREVGLASLGSESSSDVSNGEIFTSATASQPDKPVSAEITGKAQDALTKQQRRPSKFAAHRSKKRSRYMSDSYLASTSPEEVGPKAPAPVARSQSKPPSRTVSLEDVVNQPAIVPEKLDFRHLEKFEGTTYLVYNMYSI